MIRGVANPTGKNRVRMVQEIPKGHPECLRGKTFVITGVQDSLWRNEAEDLIKRHNGRVTGSVSGRTTFLLAGSQAGKSKMAGVSLLAQPCFPVSMPIRCWVVHSTKALSWLGSPAIWWHFVTIRLKGCPLS